MSLILINPYRYAVAGPTVSDSFDRADSATTMGNADTGQTWVPNSGVWGISSNQAYRISGATATTVVDSTLANCTVTATLATSGAMGPCWRSTDNNNWFILVASSGEAYAMAAGTLYLMGTGGTWVSGDIVTVVLSANSHTIKQNGTTRITYSSAHNNTATQHGLYVGSSSTVRFDDFSVAA